MFDRIFWHLDFETLGIPFDVFYLSPPLGVLDLMLSKIFNNLLTIRQILDLKVSFDKACHRGKPLGGPEVTSRTLEPIFQNIHQIL